ncbi:MAG: HEAT repeat domain-containing protein, partial [Candidatus Latescibacteria bacterium]|nr:HEAT repeat domain-containing protein [Candidatus Latescibacterota bacterium]
FALNVWRVVEADWFARLRAGVMAGASVLGVLLLLDAVWGTVGEAVSSVGLSTGGSVGLGLTALALAGLASRQAWHTLVRRAVLSMPTKTTFVGRLEHPALAVTLTPPIRDIAPAAQEAVEDYCARLSERLRHVRILDMGQPLDLEGTYIPARLVRVHGPESEVADPDAELDAADDPRHRDQIVDAQSTARHTPDDVLRRSRRVVVTGDVGAGKTTMLRHLAVQMSSPNSVGLPLYIELFEFRPPSEDEDPFVHLLRSLAEPLLSEEADDSVDAVAAYAAERLADGSAAILWDGLDEISGPTDEETQDRLEGVLRVMEAMAERFPSALMVATCRRATPERFSRLEGAFAIWQTTGFDSEDVHRFVESWFTQTPELGEQLLAELDRFPSLLTLISTPLLLALICLVFQRRGGLPQRRADLYRRCADLLLVEWDSSRGRDRHPQFLPEHKEELLRRVAWQLHLSGSQDVAADDLLSSLGDLLPEIGLVGETGEEIVSELVTHHGLLRDSAPGRYRFQHFALQEFFASESIERRVPLSAVIQQRHRPWWQEVLRLFAGRDDCTQVVRALLLEPEDLFRTNLLLAGECLAEGSGIDPFLRMLVVDELILLLQVGTYHRHREQAAFRLARLSDPNIAGKLLEMAGDKSLDELTRCGIAEALRTSRVAGVSPTIADLVLVEDLEASVRVRLVHALGDLGDATVATGLERLVDGESVPPSVRAAAAGALATLGTQDAATMLTRILLAQGVPGSVRGAVAGALRTLGPTGLMDEVLAALSDWHVDATLRAEIAHALGRLDPEGWADKLVELLADERLTPSVRIGLASALVQWGPTVHTPRLTELVAEESVDYAVRVVLAETLISISDERVRDRLEAMAASGQVDAPLRMRLLVALGGLA